MVEWGGLENRCACERTVGSNPTPSANNFLMSFVFSRVRPGANNTGAARFRVTSRIPSGSYYFSSREIGD